MSVLRVYNRYAVAEIFGGLVGWPAFLVVAYIIWFGDYLPSEVGVYYRWLLAIWLVIGPFSVVYGFYKAAFRATRWVDFGKRIHIYRLFGKETLEWEEVEQFMFDKEPVTMSAGIELLDITVTHETFLRLVDRQGRQWARLRIGKVDRAKLLERIRQQAKQDT